MATFIAPARDPELAQRLDDLGRLLPNAGPPRWLDEGRVVDIDFGATPDALPDLRARCVVESKGLALDIILQPSASRRKRLLLADMDSTMIGQECIDELADFVGIKPMVAAITERAMRGDLAFEPALRERVALLKGLSVGVVDEVLRDRITLTPGGTVLVRTMRAHGAYCALVSGGFTVFTGPVAQRIGFDESQGNTLQIEGERFSGTVADPILGREAKRATLATLRERLGLAVADTLALGDGANDLGMIEEAGLGIAYHAKPAVAALAGGRIEHCDLTAVLFAQGFARKDFVEP